MFLDPCETATESRGKTANHAHQSHHRRLLKDRDICLAKKKSKVRFCCVRITENPAMTAHPAFRHGRRLNSKQVSQDHNNTEPLKNKIPRHAWQGLRPLWGVRQIQGKGYTPKKHPHTALNGAQGVLMPRNSRAPLTVSLRAAERLSFFRTRTASSIVSSRRWRAKSCISSGGSIGLRARRLSRNRPWRGSLKNVLTLWTCSGLATSSNSFCSRLSRSGFSPTSFCAT